MAVKSDNQPYEYRLTMTRADGIEFSPCSGLRFSLEEALDAPKSTARAIQEDDPSATIVRIVVELRVQ